MLRLTCRTVSSIGLVVVLAACGGGSSGSSADAGVGTGGSGSGGSGSANGTGGSGGANGTGGSGGSAGGAVSLGLPASSVLGTLSDADSAKLCSAVDASLSNGPVKDLGCATSGFTIAALLGVFGSASDADLQKKCSDGVAACQASKGSSSCTKSGPGCMATVGEMETCLNDTRAAAARLLPSIPACATLTSALFMSDGGDSMDITPEDPPSCKALQAKCPDAMQ